MIANIGRGTLFHAGELLKSLLFAHQEEIDEAWRKAEGPLAVSLSLKFSVDEKDPGSVEIDAGISFTLEKVKENISGHYNEAQGGLFEGKPEKGGGEA